YSDLRLSPDGTHLVFAMSDHQGHEDLWIQASEPKPAVRLTSLPPPVHSPVWSPDGSHILFAEGYQQTAIYWVRSDGAGEPQLLATMTENMFPFAFSPKGNRLILESGNPFAAIDVWVASFEGDPNHPKLGKVERLLRASGFPMPAVSPDGNWLAYESREEKGRAQIYVQPFPGPGEKVPISTEGGR